MVSLGTRLVIASHNPGKVQELAALLAPFGIKTRGAAAYGVPAPEESGTSFSENAAHKAVSVARAVGLPALADDSGLSVRALGGCAGGVFLSLCGGRLHRGHGAPPKSLGGCGGSSGCV